MSLGPPPELRAAIDELDTRLEEMRIEALFGVSLQGEAAGLARTASPEPQARRSGVSPNRALVYRRHIDGGAVGFATRAERLQRVADGIVAAEVSSGNLPEGTRAAVRMSDTPVGAGGDLLAAERLSLLHPVSVFLLGDAGVADRRAQAQLTRYLTLVGGLIALLTVGVFSIYRGAARERELNQLKSDFVSTVSHELRTPLTSIRMFGEMLREGVAEGDQQREHKYHDVIVRESERLGRLIANVLDFSQIERGARRYDRKPVLVSDLVEEAVATFRRLADGESLSVSLDLSPEAAGVLVMADREALVQSFLNLLSNAAKYGGGKPVDVVVQAGMDRCRVTVRDQGPGISPRDQKRIFREFYRAPQARTSGVEGTGLGLALVKRHIEAHDGDIEVESAPGRGAAFTVVLPRYKDSA